TAARVAAGGVARKLLATFGMRIFSFTQSIGATASRDAAVDPEELDLDAVEASPVRCPDPAAAQAMVAAIDEAAAAGDTLGGTFRVVAVGVPPGLGSHVHWDRKLDGLLAQALMSIQAVKGVEIGEGFDVAGRRGSEAHDPIGWDPQRAAYHRESNWSGGLDGGITNGEPLVARVAMKPLATLNRPVLKTVDVVTKEETVSFKERTDATAVPAMGVVAETMVALVLAREALRKFGGDSLAEVTRNQAAYLAHLAETPSAAPDSPVAEPSGRASGA
ncbi:MAG: chorismate synthase, partial [Acidimicrobiales bacterium]